MDNWIITQLKYQAMIRIDTCGGPWRMNRSLVGKEDQRKGLSHRGSSMWNVWFLSRIPSIPEWLRLVVLRLNWCRTQRPEFESQLTFSRYMITTLWASLYHVYNRITFTCQDFVNIVICKALGIELIPQLALNKHELLCLRAWKESESSSAHLEYYSIVQVHVRNLYEPLPSCKRACKKFVTDGSFLQGNHVGVGAIFSFSFHSRQLALVIAMIPAPVPHRLGGLTFTACPKVYTAVHIDRT